MDKTAGNSSTIHTEGSVVDVAQEVINCQEYDDAFFICDVRDLLSKVELWKRELPRVSPFYAPLVDQETRLPWRCRGVVGCPLHALRSIDLYLLGLPRQDGGHGASELHLPWYQEVQRVASNALPLLCWPVAPLDSMVSDASRRPDASDVYVQPLLSAARVQRLPHVAGWKTLVGVEQTTKGIGKQLGAVAIATIAMTKNPKGPRGAEAPRHPHLTTMTLRTRANQEVHTCA
ncbi:hypothetical protein HPB49_010794 [Dermacentor silvarum]|uniref:Uncharacterized protein n=1 Tax=Dermacentor silvarum TaxID=543639 RepID=A0ACB8C360_DERSI|nr:hypothetical protein HPB49_010794 [Dermacentor silvarum]